MGYFKFGLKLLGSHALMTAVQSFLFLLLFGIFESEWYQWIAGIFFIALFWFIIYADASHYGQNDLKRGTFRYSKGFLSGLVASVPALILYVLSLSFSSFDLFRVTLRIWLIPYIKLMVAFENYMPAITLVIGKGSCKPFLKMLHLQPPNLHGPAFQHSDYLYIPVLL
jgi:signal transduction histidine kinase